MLIEHVSLRSPPVSNSLNCLCLIEWISASSCKLIIIKQIGMLYVFNSDNYSLKKTFHFLRPRIDPKTSCLNAQCITLCSNMSFCQLFLICFCLSMQMLTYFCIVFRQPSFSLTIHFTYSKRIFGWVKMF